MPSRQCAGVTKKGSRCLKLVSSGQFCHHHLPTVGTGTKARQDPKRPGPPRKTTQPVPSQDSTKAFGNRSRTTGTANAIHNGSKSGLIRNSHTSPNFKQGLHTSPIKYHNITGPATTTIASSPRKKGRVESSARYRNSPAVELALRPGFIYVYTLQSFLSSHGDGGWIKTRNLINKAGSKDKWVDLDMRKSKLMLVKVGMTTKTPAVRISQWEAKCNHKLACLYPDSHKILTRTSLLEKFKNLSLNKQTDALTSKFPAFEESSKGFFVPRNVLHCEREIHKALKQKYGRGEIHCTGCVENGHKHPPPSKPSFLDLFSRRDKEESSQDYNVHNEWFPVPRKRLKDVFSIINTICMNYTP